MAAPGSTPLTLLTLCSEAGIQQSHPRAGSMLRAFAQTGESTQRGRTDSALSFCCRWSHGREALRCSGDKHKAGRFLGCGIALARASLGLRLGGGCPRPLPSPGIQLLRPGQEFRPLWTVHMATMGPILRTLENTDHVEKGQILVGHKGPQCHSLDQGANGGKERHSCPPSVFPGGHCPWGPFRVKALKNQNRNPARG